MRKGNWQEMFTGLTYGWCLQGQGPQDLIQIVCVSYLMLDNRLLQNLVAQTSHFIFQDSVCWLVIFLQILPGLTHVAAFSWGLD